MSNSPRVVVYYATLNARSKIIGTAMAKGIRFHEQRVELLPSSRYRRPEFDCAFFYGMSEGLRQVFTDYIEAGRKAIYCDLGYWGRRKKTRFDGYHKLSINDRHPTAYFQRRAHDPQRFRLHGVPIEPWRNPGRAIVVVGMSNKGAVFEGFQPEQWERETVQRIREVSDRPIIYRPKPNWLGARPIEGTIWMPRDPIEDVLADAYCVVTHHSNFAVEAILAGIPAIVDEGVATVMGGRSLADLEALPRPDCRAQWAADLAWTQWSLAEMQTGEAWRYLRREGLV